MTSISCIKIAKNLQMMHLKTSLEVQIETLELLKCTFSFIEEPLFKPQNNFNLCLRKRIDWQLTCKITRQFHQDDPSEWQQSSNHKFPHFCHQPICSFHPPVANPPEKNGDLVTQRKIQKFRIKSCLVHFYLCNFHDFMGGKTGFLLLKNHVFYCLFLSTADLLICCLDQWIDLLSFQPIYKISLKVWWSPSNRS